VPFLTVFNRIYVWSSQCPPTALCWRWLVGGASSQFIQLESEFVARHRCSHSHRHRHRILIPILIRIPIRIQIRGCVRIRVREWRSLSLTFLASNIIQFGIKSGIPHPQQYVYPAARRQKPAPGIPHLPSSSQHPASDIQLICINAVHVCNAGRRTKDEGRRMQDAGPFIADFSVRLPTAQTAHGALPRIFINKLICSSWRNCA